MRWEGNVACIWKKTNAVINLVGKPEGKSRHRRRKFRWKDNINMDRKEWACKDVDWIRLLRRAQALFSIMIKGGNFTLSSLWLYSMEEVYSAISAFRLTKCRKEEHRRMQIREFRNRNREQAKFYTRRNHFTVSMTPPHNPSAVGRIGTESSSMKWISNFSRVDNINVNRMKCSFCLAASAGLVIHVGTANIWTFAYIYFTLLALPGGEFEKFAY